MANLATYGIIVYFVGVPYWRYEREGGNKHESWNPIEQSADYLEI